MGFLSDMFGGGSTTSKPIRMDAFSPEQMKMFQGLMGQAQQNWGSAATPFPRQSYVSTTPTEQQYFDYASGKLKTPASTALLNALQGKPAYDINEQATEDYYQKSIKDPSVREFRETTAPLLNEQFSGPSFWSSGRAKAIGDATEDLTNNLSSARSNLYYKDELARRDALEKAAERSGLLSERAVAMEGDRFKEAGLYSRQIEQERLASDLARWLSGESIDGQHVDVYNPNTQLMLSLLGVSPYTYATQTTTKGPGFLNQLASGVGQGIGQYGGQALGKYLSSYGSGGSTGGGLNFDYSTSQYGS